MANILKAEKAIKSLIRSFRTMYSKTQTAAHDMAVQVIGHAATHGNPVLLNEFFSILNTNDKDAFRLYMRRIAAVVGGWDGVTTKSQEEMEQFKERGAFVTFKKGEFLVLRNDEHVHAKTAKAGTIKLLPELQTPDGKVFRRFLDRNNFSEIKLVGDENIRQQLAKMIKAAKGDKKNTEAKVSPAIIAALQDAQKVIGVPASSTLQ
jgi:hypothetical protein